MKRLLVVCTALLLLAGLAATTSAQPKTDTFDGTIWTDGTVTGGGTGWNGGEWIEYPNTGWWNQWFYDDPPDPLRWKEIHYDIDLWVGPLQWSNVEVAINWSTLDYPETRPDGPPPIPPLTPAEEDFYIVRDILFSGIVEAINLTGDITIPDYNPEWVSIDLRPLTPNPNEVVFVQGTVIHRCVPEPSTFILLATGALGLLAYGWRRRRR